MQKCWFSQMQYSNLTKTGHGKRKVKKPTKRWRVFWSELLLLPTENIIKGTDQTCNKSSPLETLVESLENIHNNPLWFLIHSFPTVSVHPDQWRYRSFQRSIHHTFSGKTQGSLVRKVWNWLLIVVQRLLGESIGKASIKVAIFSKQRSIAPPAGKFFLLFKPWETKQEQ